MTVKKLHKLLSDLIVKGHERTRVRVFKDTFSSNNDEVAIHDLCGLNVELILMCDPDGGTKINKDGKESYSLSVVLYGEAGAVIDGHVKCDP